MKDDVELLRRYARERDESAFGELVRRHIDVVYATALRQCRGDAAHAQDVTQAVFTELARQASRLVAHPALLGWLHTTARFTAMKLFRTETRRLAREREASALADTLASDPPPIAWSRLQPVIDAVLADLKDRDRAAILLRFFEGKSFSEVGTALHLSETAARSCVNRALDKMRDSLARHGLTSTSMALGLALAKQSASATPPGLAATVTGSATATTAAAGTTILLGLITMKKIIWGIAGVLLLAELTTATAEWKTQRLLAADYHTLEAAQRQSAPAPSSTGGNLRISDSPSPTPATPPATGTVDELAQLQQRLAQLKKRPVGVTDSRLRPPANTGRATPRDAIQTLAWAAQSGDRKLLAEFVAFSDDTPQSREAFMAQFSAATRNRYPTPEAIVVAFSFAAAFRDPIVAQQVIDSHRFSIGAETVTTWVRRASGREEHSTLPFQEGPGGWTLTALALQGPNSQIDRILPRVDPATGEILPPK